jgi:hypothetical protein
MYRTLSRSLCMNSGWYDFFHLRLVYTFPIIRTDMKKPDSYRLTEYDATLRSEEAHKVKCFWLDFNTKPYHKPA